MIRPRGLDEILAQCKHSLGKGLITEAYLRGHMDRGGPPPGWRSPPPACLRGAHVWEALAKGQAALRVCVGCGHPDWDELERLITRRVKETILRMASEAITGPQ